MEIKNSSDNKLPLCIRAGRWVFSFRLLLGLLGVGIGAWLIQPGSLLGVHAVLEAMVFASVVIAGLGLRAWAAAHAGDHTRTGAIEAPCLSTGGPYAFVRNPIYLGSIILGLGMVGLLGDPWLFPLCLLVFAFLYLLIIPAEERFLRDTFGNEYRAYCDAVPRLIPRFRPWPEARQKVAHWHAALGEVYLGVLLLAIYAIMQSILHVRQ